MFGGLGLISAVGFLLASPLSADGIVAWGLGLFIITARMAIYFRQVIKYRIIERNEDYDPQNNRVCPRHVYDPVMLGALDDLFSVQRLYLHSAGLARQRQTN
jgi:hypothetical protein